MKVYVFAIIMVMFAGATAAQTTLQFHTSDSNIHCLIVSDTYADVRCDIYDFVPSFTIAPPDCDLDWEGVFVISEDKLRGELGCAGDTIEAPYSRMIGDEETISMGQFSCVANGSDLTCVNLGGHGFRLSREKQSLF